MTKEDEKHFQQQTICYMCNTKFTIYDQKVKDHCHLSGKYRGAAHLSCNGSAKQKDIKIPVLCHNLRGYDSHFIIKNLEKVFNLDKDKFTCIPQNSEKFITFEVSGLKFMDSFSFLPSSLEQLSSNLSNEQKIQTKKYFSQYKLSQDEFDRICKKQSFPYSWFDSYEKFLYNQLPEQKYFNNDLTGEQCSDEDYEQAQWIWKRFQCKKFQDFHDIYLTLDILLLSDVWYNFRLLCQKVYKLSPDNYITSPGLFWDAMMKKTGIILELITDPDMYQMIEKQIRGGVSMAFQKYGFSNNKYMKNYNELEQTCFLQYYDMNNLYGGAMIDKLPVRDFKWFFNNQNEQLKQKEQQAYELIEKYNHEKSDIGYVYEVDLNYPEYLHDKHQYPLAPENLIIDKIRKLVPNFNDKQKYVVNIKTLQLYVQLGLKVTKIHRVLSYYQEKFLEPYIIMNQNLRAKSTNDFEKDFFKLANNSVYGKTMENVRKRSNLKVCTNEKKFNRYVSQFDFKNYTRVTDQLYLVNNNTKINNLNKPIIIGAQILDFSKYLMYDYMYNYFDKRGESEKKE